MNLQRIEAELDWIDNQENQELAAQQTFATAAYRLAKSPRGHNAMATLLNWLDGPGHGLDDGNCYAVALLVLGALGEWPGTVREAIWRVLRNPTNPNQLMEDRIHELADAGDTR